jgi:hypothetical protein
MTVLCAVQKYPIMSKPEADLQRAVDVAVDSLCTVSIGAPAGLEHVWPALLWPISRFAQSLSGALEEAPTDSYFWAGRATSGHRGGGLCLVAHPWSVGTHLARDVGVAAVARVAERLKGH